MKWSLFKTLDKLCAGIAFVVAAFTYLLTIGPSASLWDCGEFIVSANRLEVGHPPGAPFFMLVYNIVSHFTQDSTQVAWWCNVASAIISAFTILFLFLTISHMVRRLLLPQIKKESSEEEIPIVKALVVLMSAFGGALLYTFTDSFWYSAVEAEVYAFSSFFTALVFWLMLKWEEDADSYRANKWLVLIAYFLGLSVGVHLLNLLCIPAMALIYYYRRYPNSSIKGSLLALLLSFVLVAVMMYGIIQGIPKVGAAIDIFFVNTLGFSYNVGFYFYLLLLIAVMGFSLYLLYKSEKEFKARLMLFLCLVLMGVPFMGSSFFLWALLSLILFGIICFWKKLSRRLLQMLQMSLLVIFIGISSYGLILIRASAQTPMNQNCPNTALFLKRYLNREQYGSIPLFYGETFASRAIKREKVGALMSPAPKSASNTKDEYVKLYDKEKVVYDKKMFFPRMHSAEPSHIYGYNVWSGRNPEDRSFPSFTENLRFFFSYQLNYMYWRYFAWNFVGRTNDLQGHGGYVDGGVLTGYPFLDHQIIGESEILPDKIEKNKAHNVYYLFPLLLGILGIFVQLFRGKEGGQLFWITFFFFFMTGIAIIFYLNQTTGQPRERDYAYVGSFYAFSIWIGFGIVGVYELFKKIKAPTSIAVTVASLVAIIVPLQMAGQNWDDHDRSGRRVSSDMGYNMLISCEPNSLLFCYGDNDTFPLWYVQEVEGVRRDVRTINRSYLSGEWYIDQMKYPAYSSAPLKFDYLSPSFYYKNLFVSLQEGGESSLGGALSRMHAMSPSYGEAFLETDRFVLNLNKEKLEESYPHLKGLLKNSISIDCSGKRYLLRDGVAFLDLLASNKFERKIYFARTTPTHDVFTNFPSLLSKKAFVYEVNPSIVQGTEQELDLDRAYDLVMHQYRWFGANVPNVYFDQNIRMTIGAYYRGLIFPELIEAFLKKGEEEKAKQLAQKCLQELPATSIPYTDSDVSFLMNCYAVGLQEEADKIALDLIESSLQTCRWATDLYKGGEKSKKVFVEVYRSNELLSSLNTARNAYLIAKENASTKVEKFETEIAYYLSIYSPPEEKE